jgi:hypothetical protein
MQKALNAKAATAKEVLEVKRLNGAPQQLAAQLNRWKALEKETLKTQGQ